MTRSWKLELVLTATLLAAGLAAQAAGQHACGSDLRLQRPASGFAPVMVDTFMGFDRQRFEADQSRQLFQCRLTPLGKFSEVWLARLKSPVCCPMVLCHGECADMLSACRLPDVRAVVLHGSSTSCELQCASVR